MAGVDDGFFKRSWRRTILCGVSYCRHYRGWVPVRVAFEHVEVDGLDATERIIKLVGRLGDIELLLLDTPIFAGFNIADVTRIHAELGVPVASIHLYPPDVEAIGVALRRHFGDWRERLARFEVVYSLLRRVECRRGHVLYIALLGGSVRRWLELVCSLQVYSRVPEPLHAAGRIASRLARRLSGLLSGQGL